MQALYITLNILSKENTLNYDLLSLRTAKKNKHKNITFIFYPQDM